MVGSRSARIVSICGRSQGCRPATQASIGVEKVLRIQIQNEQAWGEASLNTLERSIGHGWAEVTGSDLDRQR